jgi:hypothetical protein
VSDLPSPRARRLRPPSWRDARLLVGLVLVLASVALGARVLAAADTTVPVYAAAIALPAGHPVDPVSLRVVRVRIGQGTGPYLSGAVAPPSGAVLLRAVGDGELVPLSAIGPALDLDRRPVAVPVGAPVPAGLRPAAVVDVWSSARDPASATSFRPPVRLAHNVEIYAVTSDSSALGASRGASVQVLLGEDEVKAVLDAEANGARLAIVPVLAGEPG